MAVTLYWKSTCTSCRSARSALRALPLEVEEVNYAKTGLDEATVRSIVEAAGSVAAVLNTRHAIAKEQGWAARPPSAAAFAKAVAGEPNLLRRPIVIARGGAAGGAGVRAGVQVIVGFDAAAYAALARAGS